MRSPSSIPSAILRHPLTNVLHTDIRPCSFFASDNDMNVLIRGVRFVMRIGRAECAKGVFEPKADSTDTKDFFYMADADPDRVRTGFLPTLLPSSLSLSLFFLQALTLSA
jgi:hypothetical protein